MKDPQKSRIWYGITEKIPYQLIRELAGNMTPKEWIRIYEENYR